MDVYIRDKYARRYLLSLALIGQWNLPRDIVFVIGDILIKMNAWQCADWRERTMISDTIDKIRDNEFYIYIFGNIKKIRQYLLQLPYQTSTFAESYCVGIWFNGEKIEVQSESNHEAHYDILDLIGLIRYILSVNTIQKYLDYIEITI